MVLEDTGDPSSDKFTDNPYPSDNDPYSTPSTSTSSSSTFDDSQFQKAVPIIGPALGYTDIWTRNKTEATLKYAEQAVRRRLTQDERQALAGHLYKLECIKSYWASGGVAFGIWRSYKTMGIYKYPFYTPKIETVNPDKFLLIRGPLANYARHTWRTALYVAVGMQIGTALGTLIAQPSAANASANDPKLARFSADLKAVMAKRWPRSDPDPAQMQQHSDGGQPQQLPPHAGAPRWPRRSPQPAPPQAAQNDDDMSPTSGNEPWLADGSDSGFDSSSVEPEKKQRPTYQAQQHRQPQMQQQRSTYDDDASPTGGMFQEETQQSNSNESAWERLRRGGPPPPRAGPPSPFGPQQTANNREESNLGDSWTFSNSDEERRAAQIRAQKEFDERLERERQGKDFNDNKRW